MLWRAALCIFITARLCTRSAGGVGDQDVESLAVSPGGELMSDEMTQDDLQQDDSGRPYALYVKTLQAWAGKVMEEVIESSKQEQQQQAGAVSKETGEGDLTRKGAAALRNYYPACRVYDRLLAGTGGCAFLTETRLFMVYLTANVTSAVTQKAPVDPGGVLPQDLQDLRPGPFEHSVEIRDTERPTYYWTYRLITNLYRYAQSHWYGEELVAVPGWTEQRCHFWRQTIMPYHAFNHTPQAMTLFHPQRRLMVVVLRGTMSREEWWRDFSYQYARGEGAKLFPGRVHSGALEVLSQFKDSVMEEVERLRPDRVLLTGHSLGGALAAYLGWLIGARYPEVPINVVNFAPISYGDAAFTNAFRQRVNLRTVFYLGPGWDGSRFRAGDIIPQPGHCSALPSCRRLDPAPQFNGYLYSLPGSFVRFHSEDMPNTNTWKRREDLTTPGLFDVIASHICAYTCFTAHGLDDESRCYFADDKRAADLPAGAVCSLRSFAGQIRDDYTQLEESAAEVVEKVEKGQAWGKR